jgi:quercetin dioxygenase-like cupin family protein
MRLMVEGNGASIVLYRLEPGTNFAAHEHPFAELGVVLAGEGHFPVAGVERILREGDSFYIPPGVRHGFSVPEGGPTVVMLNVSVAVPSLKEAPSSAVLRLAESLVKRGPAPPVDAP